MPERSCTPQKAQGNDARSFRGVRGNFPLFGPRLTSGATFWPRKSQRSLEIRPAGRQHRLTAVGTRFATLLVVLHLDPRAPSTPRLPDRRRGMLPRHAASATLHATLIGIAALIKTTLSPGLEHHSPEPPVVQQRLVFVAMDLPRTGGGGGGGGNRQTSPIRSAQAAGVDKITVRVRKPSPRAAVEMASPPVIDAVPPLQSVVLDAKPLASGFFDQIGLPMSVLSSGASTGPGSGGGVGTGHGSGVGAGEGPGLGPGSGGGTGGGIYRPGGAVSAPRLIEQVEPRYTSEALRDKIQGAVWLEVVVTRDGRPSQIRVVRSLDRGGLDDEAVAAVAQWRFEPGRLAGLAVDVLVTIRLDFSIR
jgi:protein TonB